MSYLAYGFRNYANIGGRATRKQFWFFLLWFYVFIFITTAIDILIGTDDLIDGRGLIAFLTTLVFFLPVLGASVRRLHDTNKSGLWVLINIVPVIGWIVLLVFYCKKGDPSLNKYGPPVYA